ncbi:MAG TPA: tetratricopeptide repeat protein [Candidatus Polarisedimenticolaceae bacterium]|nr:tetratricopeptide repeat protein [Candidatus Polarisedimenticolaceae bacterium]
MPPLRKAGVAALLAALTIAAFFPVLEAGFTNYDDDVYVTANPNVQHGLDLRAIEFAFTSTRAANWHPLTWISHTLDWTLFGDRPAAHHAVSLLFHVANVVILFLLLDAMTGALGPSALAAALFAVHPLHVESVAWIAERKDVLSTLFGLLAIAAYVRYFRAPSAGRIAIVALFMAIGLLAKPMLVTLPFILLLLDEWPLRRDEESIWQVRVVEKLPLFVLSAASAAITYQTQHAGGAVASWERIPLDVRIGNAFWSIAAYLGKAVWPRSLAVFYPHPGASVFPWRALIGLAVVLAITALVSWQRGRRPHLLVGWLWFLVTLVPVLGFVQVGKQGMADRYMYLPSIGLFIAVAWMGRRVLVAGIPIVLALAVATFAQAKIWHDSVSLFTHAIEVAGPSATMCVDLGAAYEARGEIAAAREQYEKAIALDPGNRAAENRVAGLLAHEGKLDESVLHYLHVLERQPGDPETLSNLGIVWAKQGRLLDAIANFKKALAAHPQDPATIHTNLGNALLLSGRPAEAAMEYRESLRLVPGDRETEANLKVALERTRQ